MKKLIKVAVVLLALSCSSTVNNKPAEPVQPVETGPTTRNVWVCEDATGKTLSCESDEDCCSGFSCAKDPDGGRSARVCTWDPGK